MIRMWEVRDRDGKLIALPFYNRVVAYKAYDVNNGFMQGWTVKRSEVKKEKGETSGTVRTS